MEIGHTILQQLGGNRFVTMTGAYNFIGLIDGLSFRLPSHFTSGGINYIRVTLSPSDTYDVEFGKVRGMKYAILSTIEGVYADGLCVVIADKTGLALSL